MEQPFTSAMYMQQMHTRLSHSAHRRIKQELLTYYASLYGKAGIRDRIHHYFITLFQPPMTFTKIATYCIGTIMLSGGVFASVAPTTFVEAMAQLSRSLEQALQLDAGSIRTDTSSSSKGETMIQTSEPSDGQGSDLSVTASGVTSADLHYDTNLKAVLNTGLGIIGGNKGTVGSSTSVILDTTTTVDGDGNVSGSIGLNAAITTADTGIVTVESGVDAALDTTIETSLDTTFEGGSNFAGENKGVHDAGLQGLIEIKMVPSESAQEQAADIYATLKTKSETAVRESGSVLEDIDTNAQVQSETEAWAQLGL